MALRIDLLDTMSSENNSTRNRILQATLTLLEAGDGTPTRMSDIAKAAKISRQAVYLHFPNRADLLIAAVRHVDDIKNVEQRFATSRAAPDGQIRLAAWVDAWGNYIPEIYGVARALLAMQDEDAEARAAWEDRMKAIHHGCEAVASALQEDGVLRPEVTKAEAADLLAALVSIQSWEALCQRAGWPQDRFIKVLQETARKALLSD